MEQHLAAKPKHRPVVFISYSWENSQHRGWVLGIARGFRTAGLNIVFDQWSVVPGKRVPQFMEKAVTDSQFAVLICTPEYKRKSDNREGGVGYEGDIMTGEVLMTGNREKFIPVLRSGSPRESVPTWIQGNAWVDLRGDPYSQDHYRQLLDVLLGKRQVAELPSCEAASEKREPSAKPQAKDRTVAQVPLTATPDMATLFRMAGEFFYTEDKDAAYREILELAVSQDDFNHAVKAAEALFYTNDRDIAYRRIISHALQLDDFETAESLAGNLFYTQDQDEARQEIFRKRLQSMK